MIHLWSETCLESREKRYKCDTVLAQLLLARYNCFMIGDVVVISRSRQVKLRGVVVQLDA
jgi:hypothetical protein